MADSILLFSEKGFIILFIVFYQEKRLWTEIVCAGLIEMMANDIKFNLNDRNTKSAILSITSDVTSDVFTTVLQVIFIPGIDVDFSIAK